MPATTLQNRGHDGERWNYGGGRTIERGLLICASVFAVTLAGCGGGGAGSSSAVSIMTSTSAATPSPTPSPSAAKTPASQSAATPQMYTGVVVQAGDSIGAGEGANGWTSVDHMGLGSNVLVHNISVSGRTMVQGLETAQAEVFAFRSATSPSVLIIQQGTNDLGLADLSGRRLYESVLTPFVAAAHKAGFYVIINTILPRADIRWTSAKEAERVYYNSAVRLNAAGADGINDVAGDAYLGDRADPLTSGYYIDGLHLNENGQKRMAVIMPDALRQFLGTEVKPR